MNLVGYFLPSTVELNGEEIPINTSHRCGVRVAALIDDPTIHDSIVLYSVLKNYFPHLTDDEIEQDREALWDRAMWFFFSGNYDPASISKTAGSKKKELTRSRVWDWNHDALFLVADFQKEYGVDITDPESSLHWWRFKALFDCLGDSSITMHIKSIRARSLSDCKNPEERKLLRRQKKAFALPPRTASEVEPDV